MSEMKPMDWALPVRMFESEFWVSADQVMARQQHAKEEIDRLTAERDDALAAADSKAGLEWKKRAEKAEAERDAAVADAEKYRWLKNSKKTSLTRWTGVTLERLIEKEIKEQEQFQ